MRHNVYIREENEEEWEASKKSEWINQLLEIRKKNKSLLEETPPEDKEVRYEPMEKQ